MADIFNNPTAEKKVLASLLIDDTVLDQMINNIDITDFNIDRHRYMFDIIRRFYRSYYKRLERNILDTWLTKNDAANKTDILLLYGELHSLGCDKYARYYVDELKECSAKRKLYDVYKQIGNGLENDIDPNEIATAIVTLLKNPNLRKKLSDAGRNRVLNELSWKAVTERISKKFSNNHELCEKQF